MFVMTFHHHYSVRDIENMIPFERDIYVRMIKDYLESQKKEE